MQPDITFAVATCSSPPLTAVEGRRLRLSWDFLEGHGNWLEVHHSPKGLWYLRIILPLEDSIEYHFVISPEQ
jgi:hypothetical protein